jgi:flagellar biosynthesis protein FlhG
MATFLEQKRLGGETPFVDDPGVWEEVGRCDTPSEGSIAPPPAPPPEGRLSQSKIIAIASGKGGVGKTVLTASIGAGLAALGKRVVLVDADFGGSNLHTCLGVLEPERTFYDFFSLQVESLAELLLDTPVANLKLISGACGTLGLANPRYSQKLRFIRELKRLPGDYVLIDLGAGASFNVLDYFLACDEGIVATTPDPMALQECFNFIKVCLFRKLQRQFMHEPCVTEALERAAHERPGRLLAPMDSILEDIRSIDRSVGDRLAATLASFRPKLILNRVIGRADAQEGLALCTAVHELLGIDVEFLGLISDDPAVRKAVKEFRPFLLENSTSPAAEDLTKLIAVRLLDKRALKAIWTRRKLRKAAEMEAREYTSPDLSADPPICSYKCFHWGDCEYQDGGHPCPVRQLQPLLVL